MQRDLLLLEEAIAAADRAIEIVGSRPVADLEVLHATTTIDLPGFTIDLRTVLNDLEGPNPQGRS